MGVGGEKYIQEILVVTGRAQPLQIKSDNERLNATRQNYTYYYYYMKSVRGVIVSHCECDPYTLLTDTSETKNNITRSDDKSSIYSNVITYSKLLIIVKILWLM